MKLLTQFKSLEVIALQDGKSCFLWHDLWSNEIFNELFLELYSFVWNGMISLCVAAKKTMLYDLFHLPLSPEAYAQFLELSNIFQDWHSQQSDI